METDKMGSEMGLEIGYYDDPTEIENVRITSFDGADGERPFCFSDPEGRATKIYTVPDTEGGNVLLIMLWDMIDSRRKMSSEFKRELQAATRQVLRRVRKCGKNLNNVPFDIDKERL